MRLNFVCGVSAALAAVAMTAGAQCLVASGSNEGKLLAFYTVPIIFAPATAPTVPMPGAIRLGFEGEYIPKPSAEIQRTGRCFQSKSEHTSISPVFGRPRITIGLPGGFAVEGSYLPPVKIADAKPNLGSAAISRTSHLAIGPAAGIDVMLRAHTTFGNVKGPITCPRRSLQQSSSSAPCYGTIPSNDTFQPNMFGAELVAGVTPPTSAMSFFGGAGLNRIDPHFQVGFTDANGNVDRTKVQLADPATRLTLLAGVTARAGSSVDMGLEAYSVPMDATTFRIHAGFNFR